MWFEAYSGAEPANDSSRPGAVIRVDMTMRDFSRVVIRYAHGPLPAGSRPCSKWSSDEIFF